MDLVNNYGSMIIICKVDNTRPSDVHRLCIELYIFSIEAIHPVTKKTHSTWASYQIRKTAGCACAGNAGNVFPRRRFKRKPLVSDPGMHHGTCVTHVP